MAQETKPKEQKQPVQDKKQAPASNDAQKQIDKDKVIDDYTNHLKRLQAEFENYVKRADKERTELMQLANQKLITKLLVILDDFERAIEHMKNTQTADEVKKGIEMVFKEFSKILEAEGLKQIPAKGKLFDPYVHEVVTCVHKNDCPENTVIDEVQKGYLLGNHALRYAKVIVSKPAKQTETKGSGI